MKKYIKNSNPKVIFKFDKEKDLWNHWDKSNWNPDKMLILGSKLLK